MDDNVTFVFGDDAPKTDPEKEDKLGYSEVARRTAEVIQNLKAPRGYVIGIHGQWGTGKSTLLNFIVKYTREYDDPVTHIEFKPWIVSGHQDLISAFFKVLSEALDIDREKRTQICYRILQLFRGTTDSLVDTAATIAVGIEPSSTLAVRFAGGLFKASIRNVIDALVREPSLQAAYEKFQHLLRKDNRRFLVTIDDIDRLTATEVRSIMQMIKSIGQLPNTVYALCYDRNIIRTIFEEEFRREGPGFAEKIIQHEIELPKPQRSALLSMLDQETSFLIGPTDASSRWHYIVRSGVHRWIRTPRDVVRLANAVKFSWPALRGELDRQDLLSMEGLRLFDSDTFDWIRDNRDYFFSDGQYLLASEEKRKEGAEYLRETFHVRDQAEGLELVSVLFPQVAKWFDTEASFFSEDHEQVMRRRGIGSAAGYDSYFGLQPSPDAIPFAIIQDIGINANGPEDIVPVLRRYLTKKNSRGQLMISMLLEELRLYFGNVSQTAPSQTLFDAIFEVGEEIISIEADLEMFELSPTVQLTLLIQAVLERWGPDQSHQCLKDAFQTARSPAFISHVFVELGRELGVFVSDVSRKQHISPEAFGDLCQLAACSIRRAKESGTLASAPFYYDIVRTWAHVDNPSEPREWLRRGISDSPEFMAKTCIGLVSYSVGNGKRRYTLHQMVDEVLYDASVLLTEGRRHLSNNEINDDQKRLIEAVVNGLENFQQQQ